MDGVLEYEPRVEVSGTSATEAASANAEELSVGSTEIATTVATRGGDFAPCPSGALGCGGSDTGPSVPDLTHGASAEEVVDLAQAALDVTAASEVPIVSHAAGAVSIIIDAAKGDWVGAGLGLAGLIPVIGNAADIAKIARRADKIADAGHVVYQGVDRATGVIRYVGRTAREPAIRFGEHLNSKTARSLLQYRVVKGAEGLTKMQARILEQKLILDHGLQKNGGKLLNKINSIDPKYWKKLGIGP